MKSKNQKFPRRQPRGQNYQITHNPLQSIISKSLKLTSLIPSHLLKRKCSHIQKSQMRKMHDTSDDPKHNW